LRYYPHTDRDISEMLSSAGLKSLDGLFSMLPGDVLNREEPLDNGLSETALKKLLAEYLGDGSGKKLSFLGAGCYEHFIPSVIDHIVSRSEFYTAYTPYQPEASQGTLQTIFEYQSLMCALTGMDISNASHYDGATATAEAVLMALRSKDGFAVISSALHPRYRQVLMTYLGARYSSRVIWIPSEKGDSDLSKIKDIAGDISCGVIQSPNFFGIIEDVRNFSDFFHSKGASVIMVANPISFGLLECPAELGADIAVGEAQTLGIPMSFGGETLGYFCAREEYLRKICGRIVGMTQDALGRRGFVLTLQTREQHIRREKATSNICSNQALYALRAACYLSYMGKEGLREVSERNARNAFFLSRCFAERNIPLLFPDRPFFNEFCFRVGDAKRFLRFFSKKGVFPGVCLRDFFKEHDDAVLTCVTETKDIADIERFADGVAEFADEKK
jgi:glycine dehydrogenase subunit 1